MKNKKTEPLIVDGEVVEDMELCPECEEPLIERYIPNWNYGVGIQRELECLGCGYYEA